VQADSELIALGMLADRRDEVGRARTDTVNRLWWFRGAVVLLAAVVAVTTLPIGTASLGFAVPAGVLVGGVLAWYQRPILLVMLAAAATAALLRSIGVP
jgi:hypothetical protein